MSIFIKQSAEFYAFLLKHICIIIRFYEIFNEVQEILCRYLYANMSERNLGILLCLFTGMRVGEICALKWEDFSFQEKSIHVHNTMQRLQIPDSTTQKTCVVITSPNFNKYFPHGELSCISSQV